ncbi:hypothetical protein CAAN1_08S00584 [[Candida] anglica]|uniref:RRM domain-containing protein n=1 Tax=[Candida] anglica TaxID=148631 RepID=A0ABP0E651_9ASCO
MSNPILEKSLDEIIGEHKSERPSRPSGGQRRNNNRARVNKPGRNDGGRGDRRGGAPRARHPRPQGRSIPREILALAAGRPLLRIKNIHEDLTGQDLSQLFDGIAPVEFVKFDPADEDNAYVCFESDNARHNAVAISKFDGKKAMGRDLVVESTTSLADRIVLPSRSRGDFRGERAPDSHPARRDRRRGNGASRGGREREQGREPREARPKPVKKSVDDLDNELNAYMAGESANLPSTTPVDSAPQVESAPTAAPEASGNDEMTLD